MSILSNLDEGQNGRIILTELMRMATAMGVDTICEGVETEDQVRFLREIGCSKLQGYYYCKAIPFDEIVERYRRGIQIGYENPEESDYFESIGKINLHDLTSIAHEDEETLQNAFNMVPMAIMELTGCTVQFVRTNQTYRDFLNRYAPSEAFFLLHARECFGNNGSRTFFDEKLPDGSTARCLMRHIGTNPVTQIPAIAVAILSVA